ncbi:MAG: T9SS type A sorting domain-containing protein [Bacteroidetes bacterium]|nr:T9SS type A sorting domain-containing protein [Bacteroidota bacterium]
MKKKILFVIALLNTIVTTQAQTFFTEDFQAATTLPAGWSQQLPASIPTNKGWKIGTSVGGPLASSIPAHTQYAFVNDYDNNTAGVMNKDTLYTPNVDMTAYAHVFLSFDLWFFKGHPTSSTIDESANIAVSVDSGATYTDISGPLSRDLINATAWRNGLTFDITSIAAGKKNVKIAFVYSDNGNKTYLICVDNVKLFVPVNSYDLTVVQQNLNYYTKKNTSYTVSGTIKNLGYTGITSMHLNYSINGGAAVTDTITSVNIPALVTYNFSHNIPWVPTLAGYYTMKIWADSLNGNNSDEVHTNDTLIVSFGVFDTLTAKMPLFEEFTQASCDPCANAMPNMDSVLVNNKTICNVIRYHVNWPGVDYMNQVTQGPFVASRVSYYGVTGVPNAKLDGTTAMVPATMRSPAIRSEAAIGSPFDIVLSATYNTTMNTYSVTADIKAYGAFTTGLVAHAALTVDKITYKKNQSNESVPQYVFKEAAEAMIPGPNGTTLAAFTGGQTQTINVSWVKNHPWGNNMAVWVYDSTPVHITVWVQNKTTKYVYQSATTVPSIFAGIEELSDNMAMGIYPNPSNDYATVSVTLKETRNVRMEVYNLTGEKVYSVEQTKLNAGTSNFTLDVSAMSSGVYFVKLYSGNDEVHTQKFIVNK